MAIGDGVAVAVAVRGSVGERVAELDSVGVADGVLHGKRQRERERRCILERDGVGLCVSVGLRLPVAVAIRDVIAVAVAVRGSIGGRVAELDDLRQYFAKPFADGHQGIVVENSIRYEVIHEFALTVAVALALAVALAFAVTLTLRQYDTLAVAIRGDDASGRQ